MDLHSQVNGNVDGDVDGMACWTKTSEDQTDGFSMVSSKPRMDTRPHPTASFFTSHGRRISRQVRLQHRPADSERAVVRGRSRGGVIRRSEHHRLVWDRGVKW